MPATIFGEPHYIHWPLVFFIEMFVLCPIEYDIFIVPCLAVHSKANCFKNKTVLWLSLFYVMLQCHSALV